LEVLPIQQFIRVNHKIRAREVRVIDSDGKQLGVISTSQALSTAQAQGMDLVEIAPNAVPPVCKIVEYGKYKYEQEKKEKQLRRHQSATKVKEVQFHPNVGEHDYQTKVRHTRDFLQEGHRVKIGLFFRGRERAHQEIGFEVMNRVLKDCQDIGTPEQMPRFIGRAIFMLLCPKPGAKPRVSDGPEAPGQRESPVPLEAQSSPAQ
jgi:translation initiation factor IF-3